MFYRMITTKRNQWLASDGCTARDLLAYIERTGQMRDAQVEAIKTYLFLKIGCECKPMADLFCQGVFNTLDLDKAALPTNVRSYLQENPAAAALYEYACLPDEKGALTSEKVKKQIETSPESIDYQKFFRDAFYGVTYTDYLFSLPMGAGKTYLMAAFIYLDLYFAKNEPDNSAFAHNFIIFAPSGLKSSVVPSLKTIQRFDPAWIIPEPAASELKREIIFEVLDQSKTASKSNKTKNPNVQKIANHQPLGDLFGLVAVTNAEKVILDHIEERNGQLSFLEESDDERDRQANELRNLIGKLPALAIFVDEVHHAVSDEIKLRAVINQWNRKFDFGHMDFAHFTFSTQPTVVNVIGFSGTPYLEKAERLPVGDGLAVASTEISNIVYYYRLIDGVDNFLKRPVVKIEDVADSVRIIENGVRLFLDTFKDKVYDDGTTAKLGIYCGTIEKLEEMVFPLVSQITKEYGLSGDAILRFHKGNKAHPQPADSQMEFDILDKPISKTRIILLVQIGKEGWDCRSLTGIILSQEGDCPKNMVLQTSCRCLRQVDKGRHETALIYLNETNAGKLASQLQQQHHISLKEFTEAERDKTTLNRYDRTGHLKLPPIDFYQLKVNYDTLIMETADPAQSIPKSTTAGTRQASVVKTTDLTMETQQTEVDSRERGTTCTSFNAWLYSIVKSSFGTLTMKDLNTHQEALRAVFDQITYQRNGITYFSSYYDPAAVEAAIRKAFCEKRDFSTTEERIPEEAHLLNINNFTPSLDVSDPDEYYPAQDVVERIILDDQGKLKPKSDIEAAIRVLEESGNEGNRAIAATLRLQNSSHPQKEHSFHYLPYHTDSGFEKTFLAEVLTLAEIEQLGLEVYYNGDKALTEFKIKCYKRSGSAWRYIGLYTPDFLIIQRRDGKIYKAIIVETKGKLQANDPAFQDRKAFTQGEFLRQNNDAFGYQRFEYLYLEDTLSAKERIQLTHQKICEFFEEGQR